MVTNANANGFYLSPTPLSLRKQSFFQNPPSLIDRTYSNSIQGLWDVGLDFFALEAGLVFSATDFS